jgi:hypothetical protein
VLPMALSGLWGSFFSRVEGGGAMRRPFRRGLFSRVRLEVAAPLPAAQVSPEGLRQQVAHLLVPTGPQPSPPHGSGSAGPSRGGPLGG